MKDHILPGFSWLSVDDGARIAFGCYAVLRLCAQGRRGVLADAACFGQDGWGHRHDVFARSEMTFASDDLARRFARANIPLYRGLVPGGGLAQARLPA